MDQAAADKVKQIREYLSKMTPGPWEHNDEQTSDRGHYTPPEIFSVADEAALRIVCRLAVGRNEDHDGPGIAALRTDAEWLLSRLSASEERVRKLGQNLADAMKGSQIRQSQFNAMADLADEAIKQRQEQLEIIHYRAQGELEDAETLVQARAGLQAIASYVESLLPSPPQVIRG